MIVKVFQTNKNGKIEFTKKELETLLNEIYWDGYNSAHNTWTYTTPKWTPAYTVTTLENSAIPLSGNTVTTLENSTIPVSSKI